MKGREVRVLRPQALVPILALVFLAFLAAFRVPHAVDVVEAFLASRRKWPASSRRKGWSSRSRHQKEPPRQ